MQEQRRDRERNRRRTWVLILILRSAFVLARRDSLAAEMCPAVGGVPDALLWTSELAALLLLDEREEVTCEGELWIREESGQSRRFRSRQGQTHEVELEEVAPVEVCDVNMRRGHCQKTSRF